MTNKEKARRILKAISCYLQIDYNYEEYLIKAIEIELNKISFEEKEDKTKYVS